MPYFERFDICEAYWLYASLYHSGQWSKLYAVLGRLHSIGFTPGMGFSYSSLTDNGREIYESLVERKHLQED